MWILSDLYTFDIINPSYIVWSRFRPHRYDYIFQYVFMIINLQVRAK